MQRVRRLASAAVIAALAIGGVAACRSEPGVAAYVGPNKITEDQVDAVVADARTKLDKAVEQVREQQAANPSAGPTPPAGTVDLPIKRTDVVTTLVGRDVLRSLAQQRGLKPVQLPAEELVQAIGLPAETQYAVAYTEFRGYLDALSQSVKPAEVTQSDLRGVYDRLANGGVLDRAQTSFQAFSTSVTPEDRQTLAQNLGLRNELFAHVKQVNATINPRYGTAELPLVSFRGQQGQPLPLVVLSFDAGSGDEGPVRDVN